MKSIALKVREYFDSGSVSAVEEQRAKIPAGVRRLTAIPTLGPKKAMAVYEELGISSVEELADAVHQERLRDLKGFGPKTLHTHTDLTDGLAPLEERAEAAARRGYAYCAITDHGPDTAMQRMTDERMPAPREGVRALDGTYPTNGRRGSSLRRPMSAGAGAGAGAASGRSGRGAPLGCLPTTWPAPVQGGA